jgi:oxalate decarboxylase
MTVFDTGPRAVSQNSRPGDIGYVRRTRAHYLRNTGNADLQFLQVLRRSCFADISLSDWLTHTPPLMVAQRRNIDPAVVSRFPNNKPEVMPE